MTASPSDTGHRRKRSPRGRGDTLRTDLIQAAFELLSTESPLTLRSVARQAGVSPTAPYGQFKDLDEILIELKRFCYSQLFDTMQRAVRDIADPTRKLVALCLAYTRYGLDNPGPYKIMFATPITGSSTADATGVIGERALSLLQQCLADVRKVSPDNPDIAEDSILLWSALHGVTHLRLMKAAPARLPLVDEVHEIVTRFLASHC